MDMNGTRHDLFAAGLQEVQMVVLMVWIFGNVNCAWHWIYIADVVFQISRNDVHVAEGKCYIVKIGLAPTV